MPRVVHFEIHAADPERAMKFYQAMFGWQFNKFGPAPYWLIKTGEAGTPGIDGGLMKRMGPGPAEGQPVSSFVCTIDVPNTDGAVDKALKHGAKLALAKMAIPNVGWVAYVVDPEGNILGLYQDDKSAK